MLISRQYFATNIFLRLVCGLELNYAFTSDITDAGQTYLPILAKTYLY